MAPDIVLYIGDDAPTWKTGQPRFIDLNKCRSPNLVGEISDTTLAIDLDAKKRMYAELGISEYWVIDMSVSGMFAFRLDEGAAYQECAVSQVSPNLAIALLEETLEQLTTKTNPEAAIWFSQQI